MYSLGAKKLSIRMNSDFEAYIYSYPTLALSWVLIVSVPSTINWEIPKERVLYKIKYYYENEW